MPCSDCTPNIQIVYDNPYSNTQYNSGNCNSVGGTSVAPNDAQNIIYNGAALPCSAVATGTDLQTLIQTFDSKLCAVTGNYSTYNTYCLAPISTQQQFVESISNAYCNLNTAYTTFTGTTYVSDKTATTNLINSNNIPNITSSCTSVFTPLATDTVSQVLQKVSNTICGIYNTALNLSTVNWSQCYTVTPAPATIAQGFQTLLTQICNVKDATILPTIDNTTSCLTGGTTTDSITGTIGLIKTKLCSIDSTFNFGTLTWNCTTKPISPNNTLQGTIQTLISAVDSLTQKIPTFSSKFTTTLNGCSGTAVDLSSAVTDNKVGATPSDTTPGTLQDKLLMGDNIILDYSVAGKVKISATAPASTTQPGTVMAYSTDTAPNYLSSKLEGNPTADIYVVPSEDTVNQAVSLNVNYNGYNLLNSLLTTLSNLPTSDPLWQLFCTLKNMCPDNCGSISDVTVNYYPSSSTTTTTTTVAPTTTTTTTSTSTTSTSSTTTTTTTV